MPLHRLKEFHPNYQETLANGQLRSIDSYSVHTQGGEKVGSAKDILLDDAGRFRYLVVDTGSWVSGKAILLPIGLASFDYDNTRIYVNGLSKSQVENLPQYKDDMVVDEHHEEQVRSQYRPISQHRSSRQFMNQAYTAGQPIRAVEDMSPIDMEVGGMSPLEGSVQRKQSTSASPAAADRAPAVNSVPPVERTPAVERMPASNTMQSMPVADSTVYDRDQALYGLSEEDNHGPLRLYEERLIAHRNRSKVGEVSVGKRVVTETAEVSEPVERERVVIERHDVADPTAVVNADAQFESQEVARLEIYEEEVNVEKQAFVREEITVRKEVDQETVRTREQVRREELDVKTDGNPRINQ